MGIFAFTSQRTHQRINVNDKLILEVNKTWMRKSGFASIKNYLGHLSIIFNLHWCFAIKIEFLNFDSRAVFLDIGVTKQHTQTKPFKQIVALKMESFRFVFGFFFFIIFDFSYSKWSILMETNWTSPTEFPGAGKCKFISNIQYFF